MVHSVNADATQQDLYCFVLFQFSFIELVLLRVHISLFCNMLRITPRRKVFAIAWLIVITILFFLPGSALPKDKLLEAIQFDKCVHFAFFAILLFLWRFYLPDNSRFTCLRFILAFCSGLVVEVIQHNYVLNRSFDLGDVIADMIGAAAGLVFWTKKYIKK